MKNLLLMALMFLFLTACTTSTAQDTSIENEVNQGHISVDAVLNLARASFLKGCIQSKNIYAKNVKNGFDDCKDLADKHVIILRTKL